MSDELDPDETPSELSDAARRLELPLVPADVSRRMREAFHSSVPVITAELVVDTRRDDALAGARGGAAATWSISYRAGPCDIVFDVEPHESAVRINGQLLCPGPTADGVLRVFLDDELVSAGSTDEFGQFDLGEVPPAEYTITVTRTAHVLEIPIDISTRT